MMWKVEFNEDVALQLRASMRSGAIIELAEEREDGHELVELRKVLLDEDDGFRFYIYANEHPPPHFHVTYRGLENSFSVLTGEALYPNGDLRRYFKNVRKWYGENRALLIETWNRTRPSTCPVGSIRQ